MEKFKELARVLRESKKVVVLTGAGISAESGIPTFRGKDGLWNKYDPTELATFEAFSEDPLKVWKWYLWRMELIAKALPNAGHKSLVEFEKLFDEFSLITQNVDGLHKVAGSKKILELHGNIFEGKCRYCGKKYSEDEFSSLFPFANKKFLKNLSKSEFKDRILNGLKEEDLPKCKNCGELVGPGVVWFGESLDEYILERAFKVSEEADVFFSVGTSALVQPAASLPLIAKRKGAILIEINPQETPISSYCDFVFRESAKEILPFLVKELR
ncbi:MAG: NAD-dependent deacylase [Desulfurobacteriaceae bacterium]